MTKISRCRVCGSKALTPAFSIGDGGKETPRLAGRRRRYSSEYVLCDTTRDAMACGLLQSAEARQAPIASSPSSRYASVRNHLRAAATEALELISGRDGAALDIGCSDGSLLSFYPRWIERFGIDQSSRHVGVIGAWATTAHGSFPSPGADKFIGARKFDIVTAISVLEELDDPKAFLQGVKAALADDGVAVVETLYAPVTLTRTQVETFLAGVSAVYSLAVLERLARECGLKIFRGALTDKEGGSIRLFLTHEGVDAHDFEPWQERLARLWDEENALSLRTLHPYRAFEQRANEARGAFISMLTEIASRREVAHLACADARAEALLSWAGPAARAIEAAIDDGFGPQAQLGGDGPRLITESESRAREPDYLVAPASLKREALERWRESVLLGGQIVFATPFAHAVHAQNYAAEYAKTLASGDGAGGIESLRAILGAAGAPRLVASSERKAASA
jgi:2-polyprenyl-3-methyl-5-hydroxy-6-metoxy-1,4-benzoquinol methylase